MGVEATEGALANLTRAAQDTRRVQGSTHRFYRYPARFSPHFVQAAIEQFTQPGDLVFDPFVGGGTTLVEAMRLGRAAIGTDINELAIFVSQVKTTLLSESVEQALRRWTEGVSQYVNMRAPAVRFTKREDSEKGAFTYDYFNLAGLEREILDKAQGAALVEEPSEAGYEVRRLADILGQ